MIFIYITIQLVLPVNMVLQWQVSFNLMLPVYDNIIDISI